MSGVLELRALSGFCAWCDRLWGKSKSSFGKYGMKWFPRAWNVSDLC